MNKKKWLSLGSSQVTAMDSASSRVFGILCKRFSL
jgi:hypothetical protein